MPAKVNLSLVIWQQFSLLFDFLLPPFPFSYWTLAAVSDSISAVTFFASIGWVVDIELEPTFVCQVLAIWMALCVEGVQGSAIPSLQ